MKQIQDSKNKASIKESNAEHRIEELNKIVPVNISEINHD